MYYTMLLKYRAGVVCYFRSFKTTSLVNAHIYYHGACFHLHYHLFRNYAGRTPLPSPDSANGYIGGAQGARKYIRVHDRCKYPRAEVILQPAQFIKGVIKNFYVSAQAKRGLGSELSYRTPSQNYYLGRRNAGDSSKHYAFTMINITQ